MKVSLYTPLLAIGSVALATASAQAIVINFETLPNGNTPTDNQQLALLASYNVDGSTSVSFGFDTNDDLVRDVAARLESRTDATNTNFGYTSSGVPDADLTTTDEGGNWLLRTPRGLSELPAVNIFTGADFLITYSGTLPNSASGEIWDLDLGEKYQIDALGVGGSVISSIVTPDVTDDENPSTTFNGLPYTFSFSNLNNPIAFIRISGTDIGVSPGGFAFDNFDATNPVDPPVGTPEPTSVLALIVGASLVTQFKKNKKFHN